MQAMKDCRFDTWIHSRFLGADNRRECSHVLDVFGTAEQMGWPDGLAAQCWAETAMNRMFRKEGNKLLQPFSYLFDPPPPVISHLPHNRSWLSLGIW